MRRCFLQRYKILKTNIIIKIKCMLLSSRHHRRVNSESGCNLYHFLCSRRRESRCYNNSQSVWNKNRKVFCYTKVNNLSFHLFSSVNAKEDLQKCDLPISYVVSNSTQTHCSNSPFITILNIYEIK